MNSRSVVNLILLLLIVLIITFLMIKKRQPPLALKLTSLEASAIWQIRIPAKTPYQAAKNASNTQANEQDIMLRRSKMNGKTLWYMQQPFAIKAHQFRIQTLIGLSQVELENSYDAHSLKLSDFGLKPPRAQIIFNQTQVSFGNTNPVNHKRYLATGNKVVLLEDKTYPLVSAQATSLVDLHLLPDVQAMQSIHTSRLKLDKKLSGLWQKQPAADAMNADQVQHFIDNWKSAQAFAVHSYMPRKQLGEIKIRFTDYHGDHEVLFEISEKSPWLILARPALGIEYHLDSAYVNKLLGRNDA